MTVYVPDASDIDVHAIRASTDLRDSTNNLDDFETMSKHYEEDGYLLFRNVLDPSAVDRAFRRMMVVLARFDAVNGETDLPIWTGTPLPSGMEESPEFKGICRELMEHPANMAVFEKILGEAPTPVPIVQYRSYPPGTPPGPVHQDGFYSPGIRGFKPVWMPLMTITPEIGGLVIAPGQHRRGLLHNLAKPPNFLIPEGQIPDDAWATTTYHAGDMLVVHPALPHTALPNRSDQVRISIDSRVQSASDPCVLLGDVVAVSPDSLTLRTASGDRAMRVTERTYIRTGEARGSRVPLEALEAETPLGLRVVASIEDGEALMLRRASEA